MKLFELTTVSNRSLVYALSAQVIFNLTATAGAFVSKPLNYQKVQVRSMFVSCGVVSL